MQRRYRYWLMVTREAFTTQFLAEAYLAAVKGDSPLLILWHDATGSTRLFDPQTMMLAAQRTLLLYFCFGRRDVNVRLQ